MVVVHRAAAAAIAATLALAVPQAAGAGIQGCPGEADAAGEKVVIGSVEELAGQVSERLKRAILSAFELHFEKAEADLAQEALIVYCDRRRIRASGDYNADVVGLLNDERVLLEVGAKPDAQDINVIYVVIPIRHFAFSAPGHNLADGYHSAVYAQSQISEGLDKLFKGNAELRLMAALALGLRQERNADVESDAATRRTLMGRARQFYCDAVGSLEAARPRPDFFGLPEAEWRALKDFAEASARRAFEKAVDSPSLPNNLEVVASERADTPGDNAACS